ncbi:AAA family ATPase, partial [Candidatus Micrarchaeota archaeon]|nr:AAA family ATPase [Candidatus Micrarchaeota archaeon]
PDLRTPLEMLNKYTAKTNCPILYLQNFQDKISRLTEFRKLISEQALNPTRSLNSEGDNLVNYLHFLKTNDEEKFLEIQNALKEVYTFGSLCSPVDPNTKIVRVGLIKNKKEVTLDNLGSGIFEILIVLTYILSRKKGDIVILEEPENHLHPSAIEKLKNIIDRKKDMVQFFIISHSPYMLNHYNLEDLRSIRRFYLDEKETTKTAMVPKDFFTYVASDDEIRTNEEVYETMTKLNRDLLMSIFLDDVYLVEGAGDVIYFSKLINMISKETNYVIDVGGDGSLLSVSKFLSYLKIKHKVIADENEDRKEHHKEIENSGVPIHILDKKLEHYLIDKTDHIKPPKTFEQVRKLEEIGLEKARTQIGEKRYDALLTFLTETTPAFGRHNQQK